MDGTVCILSIFAQGGHMKRRNFTLSTRHDRILLELSRSIGVSLTEVVQRGLEALEEKEAVRNKEVQKGGREQ